jgi:hypothetical protein
MTKHHPHPHHAHDESATHRRAEATVTLNGAFVVGQILCVFLVVWGLVNAVDTLVFLATSTATSGHVVQRLDVTSRVPYSSRGGLRFMRMTTRYVDVEYTDRRGSHRSADIPEGACWFADEAHLPIRYDGREPPRVRVITFFGLWAKATALMAAGAVGWLVVGRDAH